MDKLPKDFSEVKNRFDADLDKWISENPEAQNDFQDFVDTLPKDISAIKDKLDSHLDQWMDKNEKANVEFKKFVNKLPQDLNQAKEKFVSKVDSWIEKHNNFVEEDEIEQVVPSVPVEVVTVIEIEEPAQFLPAEVITVELLPEFVMTPEKTEEEPTLPEDQVTLKLDSFVDRI